MWIYKDKEIKPGVAFTLDNGKRMSAGWVNLSADKKAAFGIKEVTVTADSTPEFNPITERLVQSITKSPTNWHISYSVVEKDFEAAKQNIISALDRIEQQYENGKVILVGTDKIPVNDRLKEKLTLARGKATIAQQRIGKEVIDLTPQKIASIDTAVTDYMYAVGNRAAALQEQINAATTIDDLKALDINSGWPTTVEPPSDEV